MKARPGKNNVAANHSFLRKTNSSQSPWNCVSCLLRQLVVHLCVCVSSDWRMGWEEEENSSWSRHFFLLSGGWGRSSTLSHLFVLGKLKWFVSSWCCLLRKNQLRRLARSWGSIQVTSAPHDESVTVITLITHYFHVPPFPSKRKWCAKGFPAHPAGSVFSLGNVPTNKLENMERPIEVASWGLIVLLSLHVFQPFSRFHSSLFFKF